MRDRGVAWIREPLRRCQRSLFGQAANGLRMCGRINKAVHSDALFIRSKFFMLSELCSAAAENPKLFCWTKTCICSFRYTSKSHLVLQIVTAAAAETWSKVVLVWQRRVCICSFLKDTQASRISSCKLSLRGLLCTRFQRDFTGLFIRMTSDFRFSKEFS